MVLPLLLANAGGEPQEIWQPGHLQRLRDASSPFPTPTFLKPRARHIAMWDRTERCSRQLWWLALSPSARPTTVSRHPRTHQKHTSTSKQPRFGAALSRSGEAKRAAPLRELDKHLRLLQLCVSLLFLPDNFATLDKTRVRGETEVSSFCRVHTYLSVSAAVWESCRHFHNAA